MWYIAACSLNLLPAAKFSGVIAKIVNVGIRHHIQLSVAGLEKAWASVGLSQTMNMTHSPPKLNTRQHVVKVSY